MVVYSRFNSTTYRSVNSLDGVIWLMDPTLLPYVREAPYSVSSSDYIMSFSNAVAHVSSFTYCLVGLQFNEKKYFEKGYWNGLYYYLKPHDTHFHPNHKCSSNYCVKGWYPTEAFVCTGDYSSKKKMKFRSNTPNRLRHQVFSRDGYKCVECGISNKQGILEIDHLVPFSKGGLTDLNNLQTLCRDCNRGKLNDFW